MTATKSDAHGHGRYEPGGRGFESCRARQIIKDLRASSALVCVPAGPLTDLLSTGYRHSRRAAPCAFPHVLTPDWLVRASAQRRLLRSAPPSIDSRGRAALVDLPSTRPLRAVDTRRCGASRGFGRVEGRLPFARVATPCCSS